MRGAPVLFDFTIGTSRGNINTNEEKNKYRRERSASVPAKNHSPGLPRSSTSHLNSGRSAHRPGLPAHQTNPVNEFLVDRQKTDLHIFGFRHLPGI